jgi:hypothetical protein
MRRFTRTGPAQVPLRVTAGGGVVPDFGGGVASPRPAGQRTVARTIAGMSGKMIEYSPVSSNMMIGAPATPANTVPMPANP